MFPFFPEKFFGQSTRMSGHLSLITGLLLKDCLEDQRNLLVPDGGGHILAVTHTAAVQWFRLMMSVAPSSLEAGVTNGRTLRAVLALWDLWSWGESCSLEGAAAALEPKVAAGSKFKGKAACSGGGWTCLLHGWIAFLIRIG